MPTSVQQLTIGVGDVGVRQTVSNMARIITDAIATPIVRDAIGQIVSDVPGNDWQEQCYALRAWLAQHIVFMRDPSGKELLHTPEWLLRRIARDGVARVDCDDTAVLAGALAGSIGLRVVLLTVSFLDNPETLSHVWASASFVDTGPWIELDVTRPSQMPIEMVARAEWYPVC